MNTYVLHIGVLVRQRHATYDETLVPQFSQGEAPHDAVVVVSAENERAALGVLQSALERLIEHGVTPRPCTCGSMTATLPCHRVTPPLDALRAGMRGPCPLSDEAYRAQGGLNRGTR